jgi:hypothetical protein
LTLPDRYQCSVSRYGGQVSTVSRKVFPKQWLQYSMDKPRLDQLNSQVRELKERNVTLLQLQRQLSESQETFRQGLEAKAAELRGVKQKRDHKRVLESRLQTKRNQMKAFLTTDGNTAREKKRIAQSKVELGKQVLSTADDLRKVSILLLLNDRLTGHARSTVNFRSSAEATT